MAELKPCPFCGGKAYIDREEIFCDCGAKMPFPFYEWGIPDGNEGFPEYKAARAEAIERWNRRTTVETNIYDKEETYPNCTVQVLTNTATGETSVGWWENGGKTDNK